MSEMNRRAEIAPLAESGIQLNAPIERSLRTLLCGSPCSRSRRMHHTDAAKHRAQNTRASATRAMHAAALPRAASNGNPRLHPNGSQPTTSVKRTSPFTSIAEKSSSVCVLT